MDENRKLDDFLTARLGQVACPTLLLYGENDIIAPVDPHTRHLRQHIAKCRIHVFPNTSHYCHQEKAIIFNKIVEKFLLSQ